MYEEEIAQLVEIIPKGIEPRSLPFTDIGDFFNFIGLMVIGGLITMWLLWKFALALWYEIKHWRKK